MRFRILDLLLATAFIAAMLGAYSKDLIFFRQILFLGCTTVFATLGCLWFSKKNNLILIGALAGTIGGLVFSLIAMLSLVPFYFSDKEYLLSTSPLITYTLDPAIELFLAPLLATIVGSAIGPLFWLYLTGKPSPSNRIPQVLSWCFLGAVYLSAFFSMMDRLDFGSPSRRWMYAVPLLLTIFVVHTTQWIQREHCS